MAKERLISDDEFGRYFEIGMKARCNGAGREACTYKCGQRRMAWRDGWDAANADITIHNVSPRSILQEL